MRDEARPGRPREFDGTQMLRRIMQLFWRKGYEGVSLADIMAETGLKKGSLYAAYGDKRSMYLKALSQYQADVVDSAARFLRDRSAPPKERLQAFLSAPLEAAQKNDRSGCFLCNASADQADLDQEAKKLVARGFGRLKRSLACTITDLVPEMAQDQLHASANALLAVYIGLRIMVRSGAPIETLRPSTMPALRMIDDGLENSECGQF